MLKKQIPPPSRSVMQLNTNVEMIFDFLGHFHSLYRLFPVLNPYCLYFSLRCDVRRCLFSVNFTEDSLSLITDISSTKPISLRYMVQRILWKILIRNFNNIWFKANLWRYYFQHYMVYSWHYTNLDRTPWPLFAGFDSKLFVKIKEYISCLDLKLFDTIYIMYNDCKKDSQSLFEQYELWTLFSLYNYF